MKKKAILQSICSLLLFCLMFFLLSRVDWLRLFQLSPTAITDKGREVLWTICESGLEKEHSPHITQPVDSLLRHLCQSNGIERESIHLVIAREKEVNAFAYIGNHLVIHTALIGKCRNEQELCGVICHELAHIQKGHIKQKVSFSLALSSVLYFLSGGQDSGAAANIIQHVSSAAFSRDLEAEADLTAVLYMKEARINPMGLATFLEEMESYGVLEYLMEHPDTQKRAANIRKEAQGIHPPFIQVLNPNTWQKMTDECRQQGLQ